MTEDKNILRNGHAIIRSALTLSGTEDGNGKILRNGHVIIRAGTGVGSR